MGRIGIKTKNIYLMFATGNYDWFGGYNVWYSIEKSGLKYITMIDRDKPCK